MPVLTESGWFRPLAQQAFAETSPQFYQSYFVPNLGLDMQDSFVTYGAMYQLQSNVFACVDKIASLISKLDVSIMDESDPDHPVEDRDSDYANLMRNPCLTLDPVAFYHWLATTYEVYGEAYLIKNRVGGKVHSFIPMHPSMTHIRRDSDGRLMYRFTGQPNEELPESEVLAFRRYNPFNTMRGMSRLEPLRLTLMNEDGARRAQLSWWKNMCRPSMVLSTPKKLGQEGRQRLQAAVSSAQSSADNTGGTLVLEDEVTATRMQLGAEEVQYIQSRLFNREEVCSAYDIAPQAVQFMTMGDVGITSYQFVARDVYKYSISPRVRAFESVFNFGMAEMDGPTKLFKFNAASQWRGDIETLAPAAVQLVQSGIGKPGEMREWLGLSDAGDETDILYANQALKPLSDIVSGDRSQPALNPGDTPRDPVNDTSPAASADLPQHVPNVRDKSVQNYVRAISGAVGRGETIGEFALKMYERNPNDLQAIYNACELVIGRNDSK